MDNTADVIRRLKPLRVDGTPIPWRHPVGWTHMAIAFAKFAYELRGDLERESWVDALRAVVEMANATDFWTSDEPDDPASRAADYFIDSFVAVCANETLRTGFRQIGGGSDVSDIPPSWWDLEQPELRFRTWSIDPTNPVSRDEAPPCWIWVGDESLERQLERIRRHRWNIGKVMFYAAGLVVGVADALRLLEGGGVENASIDTLAWLCARNAVRSTAGRMTRYFRSTAAEQDRDWAVPAELWASIDTDDPRSSLVDGRFYAPMGRSEYMLEGILFDVGDLKRALLGRDVAAPLNLDGGAGGVGEPSSVAQMPKTEDVKALAAQLDAEGIGVRHVSVSMITKRWDAKDGSAPLVKQVTSYMKGGGKGGRPKGS